MTTLPTGWLRHGLHSAVPWLLLGACGVSLAHWGWRLVDIALARPSLPPTAVEVPDTSVAGRGWFAAAPAGRDATAGRFVLKWAYPGPPQVAILALPGLQESAYVAGEEISPGVVLKEAAREHVILDERGRLLRIELESRDGGHAATDEESAAAPGR